MITVHHLNNSRSQRVLWLLEELGCPYEVKRYERDATTLLAPKSLRAVHPLGKSPVVTDGALTVAETGTIVEYLLDRYGEGRFQPAKDGPDWWTYRYWMHYAEGSAMPLLVMKLIFMSLPRRVPWPLRPFAHAVGGTVQAGYLDPQLETHKDLWNSALKASGWFAGAEFGAADIMMSFPLEAAASRSPFGQRRPALTTFLDRIHARPAYARALERGGPYRFAPDPKRA